MSKLLLNVLDWSEIWALLIPLLMLLFRRRQPGFVKPVIVYLCLALVINLVTDLIWALKIYFPSWLQSNNPLYNVHSIIRFICFSIFFIKLPQTSFITFKKILTALSLVFILINFGFFENFFNPQYLSGNLLAGEAYRLLVYCMLYYLSVLRNESDGLTNGPDFWIVTGLSIYVVSNFFIFLFYVPMNDVNPDLAINMWNVHNIAYIIFCIFITKALYGPFRHKLRI